MLPLASAVFAGLVNFVAFAISALNHARATGHIDDWLHGPHLHSNILIKWIRGSNSLGSFQIGLFIMSVNFISLFLLKCILEKFALAVFAVLANLVAFAILALHHAFSTHHFDNWFLGVDSHSITIFKILLLSNALAFVFGT